MFVNMYCTCLRVHRCQEYEIFNTEATTVKDVAAKTKKAVYWLDRQWRDTKLESLTGLLLQLDWPSIADWAYARIFAMAVLSKPSPVLGSYTGHVFWIFSKNSLKSFGHF